MTWSHIDTRLPAAQVSPPDGSPESQLKVTCPKSKTTLLLNPTTSCDSVPRTHESKAGS